MQGQHRAAAEGGQGLDAGSGAPWWGWELQVPSPYFHEPDPALPLLTLHRKPQVVNNYVPESRTASSRHRSKTTPHCRFLRAPATGREL